MESKKIFLSLLFLLLGVYAIGLFSGLLENDSAQFAVMSMRMVQEGDFLSLYKGTEPYLDKPHLHYWLAAASYTVFGIYEFSYKLPGFLALLLGAFSVFKMAQLLYSTPIARAATLIFLSAQTIVLSGIDLRTDAVLTGFVALSLWQFLAFLKAPHWRPMVFGALAAAMAFSTKGHLALVMIGFPVLGYLIHERQWSVLLKKEILLGVFTFILGICPILYAYYVQFDLHPELVIRGQSERSGIFFILFEQSFERMSGQGMGTNSPDYLFFFHTFLWAFLPFTPLAIYLFFKRFKSKLLNTIDRTQGLLYGSLAILLLISFAQFKLPHYLNSSMPLWAVLVAGRVGGHGMLWKPLLYIQRGLFVLLTAVALALCLWIFPYTFWGSYLMLALFVLASIYWMYQSKGVFNSVVITGVLTAVLVNGMLNTGFYPKLLRYQAGKTVSEKIMQSSYISPDKVYKWGNAHSWAMDFGLRSPLKIVDQLEDFKALSSVWVYLTEPQLEVLSTSDISYTIEFWVPSYRITRLKGSFLNPATRLKTLEKRYLVFLPGAGSDLK